MTDSMYVLETIVCSALFYLLYRLFLEGRVAHSVARWYLLLSVVFSVALPMLELPILPADSLVEVAVTPLEISQPEVAMLSESGIEESRRFDWWWLLVYLYLAVTVLFIARFAVSLIRIYRLRKCCNIGSYRDCYLAMGEMVTEPFSFGRTIFVSVGERREQVLLHEYSHVSHNHTAERIFFSLARCILWFNPFVHFISKAVIQVQEWQADSDVIKQGFDVDQYRQIIFHQLFGYTPDITCGLNNNLTKKRFIMMTQFKKGRYSLLRLCAVVPIVVAIILAFGSVKAQPEPIVSEPAVVETEAAQIVVQIRNQGEKILLNQEPVTIEQLPELVKDDEDEVVVIEADGDVPMETVLEVEEALRSAGKLRLTHQDVEQKAEQMAQKVDSLVKSGVVESAGDNSAPQTETKTIKARNLLQVEVAADGTILLRGKECSKSKLKKEVKRFVHNFRLLAINTRILHVTHFSDKRDKEYSEFTTVGIKMPGGLRLACPVSKGVVSISSHKDADVAAVNETIEIVKQAYDELRQKLSRRMYNKSYDKLDETYKAEVNKAVPYQIYIAE